MVIAYNFCYSTCLGPARAIVSRLDAQGGEVGEGREPLRFGCFELSARGFATEAEAAVHPSSAAQLHCALHRLAAEEGKYGSAAEGGAEGGTVEGSAGAAAAAAAAVAAAGGEGGEGGGGGGGEGGGGEGGEGGEGRGGVHVSANGLLFASAAARPGLLPRLLREILETRFMVCPIVATATYILVQPLTAPPPAAPHLQPHTYMMPQVKRAMKRVPAGSPLHRTLNSQQFALKLIANVTYGYASASFSGRMPNVHLADAIVQTGRASLEATIAMVNAHPRWNARVVYGDTDSLFVLLEGRTRQEAFEIGREIAEVATAANPPPMELELEKVYQPCVLLTKKRYAGYMYESAGQSAPTWDAKGIETVRRDGCPAERKILERAMRLLFDTQAYIWGRRLIGLIYIYEGGYVCICICVYRHHVS